MGDKIPCEAFVDSGETRIRAGAAPLRERVCATCRWDEYTHDEETRQILRGEHPDSMPDGQGGFFRRPKFGPLSGRKTRFA